MLIQAAAGVVVAVSLLAMPAAGSGHAAGPGGLGMGRSVVSAQPVPVDPFQRAGAHPIRYSPPR